MNDDFDVFTVSWLKMVGPRVSDHISLYVDFYYFQSNIKISQDLWNNRTQNKVLVL